MASTIDYFYHGTVPLSFEACCSLTLVVVDAYEHEHETEGKNNAFVITLFDPRYDKYETVKYSSSKAPSRPCSCGSNYCEHWFYPLVRSGVIASRSSLSILHPQVQWADFGAAVLFSNLMLRMEGSTMRPYYGPHVMKFLREGTPASDVVVSPAELNSLTYNHLAYLSTFKRKICKVKSVMIADHFRRVRHVYVCKWLLS